MKLIIDGHRFHYEMQRLVGQFFPLQKITLLFQSQLSEEDYVYTGLHQTGDAALLRASCFCMGKVHTLEETLEATGPDFHKNAELAMGRLVYRLLAPITGISPPWGILTGIRPVKLLRQMQETLPDPVMAQQAFAQEFLVSPQKLALAVRTRQNEDRVLARSRPESFSLYVSIPFCPSRCRYCSFISQNIAMAYKVLPDYLRLLCQEIRQLGPVVTALGLRLETVYFGGGTPTTLQADQLAEIMTAIEEAFDLSTVSEYTVEAGRPDTITPEKLAVIRQGGAGRVSVNPQTFNPQVLAAIGREHTVEQFYQGFAMARDAGFDCINIDLIAGLPGDSLQSFQESVEKALALNPENITLHTLSVKRATDLGSDPGELPSVRYGQAVDMVDYGHRRMGEQCYLPYYLYRQQNMAGNLENTGFSRSGHEGLYNVYIMDETHSILAVGAGAVTKLRHPTTGVIRRLYNLKYPFEYISRFAELADRPEEIIKFYQEI